MKRKSLLKVDYDIILLGVYYILIILAYLMFEIIPINYRPILINGVMESSYPSSTTLLVLGRWICRVHWFTDIVGSVTLSTGLFYVYKALVLLLDKKGN